MYPKKKTFEAEATTTAIRFAVALLRHKPAAPARDTQNSACGRSSLGTLWRSPCTRPDKCPKIGTQQTHSPGHGPGLRHHFPCSPIGPQGIIRRLVRSCSRVHLFDTRLGRKQVPRHRTMFREKIRPGMGELGQVGDVSRESVAILPRVNSNLSLNRCAINALRNENRPVHTIPDQLESLEEFIKCSETALKPLNWMPENCQKTDRSTLLLRLLLVGGG